MCFYTLNAMVQFDQDWDRLDIYYTAANLVQITLKSAVKSP